MLKTERTIPNLNEIKTFRATTYVRLSKMVTKAWDVGHCVNCQTSWCVLIRYSFFSRSSHYCMVFTFFSLLLRGSCKSFSPVYCLLSSFTVSMLYNPQPPTSTAQLRFLERRHSLDDFSIRNSFTSIWILFDCVCAGWGVNFIWLDWRKGRRRGVFGICGNF